MEVKAGQVRYRPYRSQDLEAVKDIIQLSFPEEVAAHPEALSQYPNEAYYQPENLLVAEVDGRVVSHMGLRQGPVWLSGRPFPAALVGTVCTHPDYRGRGIGGGLLRYSFDILRANGVALSYLHTIPPRYNFYRRLGYTASLHEQTTLVCDPADIEERFLQAEGRGEPFRSRRALPADTAILDALYQQTARRGTGAWSRNEHFWKRRLQGHPKLWLSGCPDFELALTPEPAAYVAAIREGSQWRILELAYRDGAQAAARTLVAGVVAAAGKVGAAEVRITLPAWMEPEEWLALFASRVQTKRERVFLRLHDVDRFLELASPVLQERAEAAGLRLNLVVQGTPSRHLQVGSGSTDLSVTLGPSQLAALFYNGAALAELAEAGAVKVRPEDPAALQRLCDLFPVTRAGRFPMDGY